MTTRTPYPSYNPSGIDWLGDIPSHWRTSRLGSEGKFFGGAGFPPDRQGDSSKEIPFYRVSDMNHPSNEQVMTTAQSTVSNATRLALGAPLVPAGAIIFPKIGAALATNKRRLLSRPSCIDNNCMAVRFTSLHTGFGYRLMSLIDAAPLANPGPVPSLNVQLLKAFAIAVPPLEEQRAITEYLDRKDDEITRFIESRRRMIALLEEKKQAIINQAVTRGLDPTVPMKDSGVEWLGEIPAHWEVRRNKDWLREVDDRSESGDEELLSVSHITGVTRRSEKNVTMFQAESYAGSKLCKPGDVVANTMWMWMGAVGISRLLGIVSPSYGVYRPWGSQQLHSDYAERLLRLPSLVEYYGRISTGIHASRLRLYPDQFLRISIPMPPKVEQDQIAAFLDITSQTTTAAISRYEREIELMQEYRTRLISDVVTGKVRVS